MKINNYICKIAYRQAKFLNDKNAIKLIDLYKEAAKKSNLSSHRYLQHIRDFISTGVTNGLV